MRQFKERIDVIVTAEEKRRVTLAARNAGISTGAYMRRAAAPYCTLEEDAIVDAMLRQLNESTRRASVAVDSALAWVEASNRRIATMERAAAAR